MRVIRSGGLMMILVGVAGCIAQGQSGPGHLPKWTPMAAKSPKAEAYSRYLAATMLEHQGKYSQALAEMEKVPQLDAEAVTPVMRLIRAHLRQRDFEQALAMAERAVKQDPDRPSLWIVLGEIYHHLKRYDDATQAFNKVIELSPDNVMGYGALVELQENTNDLVAAIDIYHRLLKINPNAAALHYQLGINLVRINDSENARVALEKALELSPSLTRAHYLLGVLYLEAEDTAKAIEHLQSYLAERADDSDALQSLAGAYARAGRLDEARKTMDTIIASDDAQPIHYLWGMYLALQVGDAEAVERLSPPDGAPILSTLLRAMAREAGGQPHLPLLESLDTVEGDLNAEVETYLNDLLFLFGKDAVGAQLLQKIEAYMNAGAQSRTLGVVRGRVLMVLDRTEDAVAIYEALLAKNPEDGFVHYYLAIAHENLKHFEETEAHLQVYILQNPEDADAINFLAYLYAEKGVKLEEAEQMLEKALQLSPDNPYYLDSLGWVYYRQGKAQEAIDHIQRAIYGMATDDAVLRDHLGDAYLLKGDRDRAIAEWERALRLDPKIEGVREKLDQHQPTTAAK